MCVTHHLAKKFCFTDDGDVCRNLPLVKVQRTSDSWLPITKRSTKRTPEAQSIMKGMEE